MDDYDDESKEHFDGKINYDPSSAENAARCLRDMQSYENMQNFGKLKYESPEGFSNKRYNEPEYYDTIDSTFYTDMATSTLLYTMSVFYQMGDPYSDDVVVYFDEYFSDGSHDLVNDSSGEYANFNGDNSLFDPNLHLSDAESLYAYYNEFHLVTGDDERTINYYTFLDGEEPKIVLSKTTNINGVDVDFYYVGTSFNDFSTQLLQHDYNANFLAEKVPANVLETNSQKNGTTIVTVSDEIRNIMALDGSFSGYSSAKDGYIVINDNDFTYAIVHELGHIFDYSYNNKAANSESKWGGLAEKYADDLGVYWHIGYSASEMKSDAREFYAVAFELYFDSPETRAALPKEVREALEEELGIEPEETDVGLKGYMKELR